MKFINKINTTEKILTLTKYRHKFEVITCILFLLCIPINTIILNSLGVYQYLPEAFPANIILALMYSVFIPSIIVILLNIKMQKNVINCIKNYFSHSEIVNHFLSFHNKNYDVDDDILNQLLVQIYKEYLTVSDIKEFINFTNENIDFLSKKQLKKLNTIIPTIKDMLESKNIDESILHFQPLVYKINKKLNETSHVKDLNELEKHAL